MVKAPRDTAILTMAARRRVRVVHILLTGDSLPVQVGDPHVPEGVRTDAPGVDVGRDGVSIKDFNFGDFRRATHVTFEGHGHPVRKA